MDVGTSVGVVSSLSGRRYLDIEITIRVDWKYTRKHLHACRIQQKQPDVSS